MKTAQVIKNRWYRHSKAAFTLTEVLVALAIFSFVVLALTGLQLFAMRIYTLGATMLSATTSGRETMNDIRDHIRSGKVLYVGTYNPTNGTGFVQIPLGSPQKGNALEIAYTNTADNYLIYYQDPNKNNISCFSNSIATANTNTPIVIEANYVTNYYCFFAEDALGNTLTNQTSYANNPVIHVLLQFYQWEYPIGIIGTNSINAYNFYNLNARVSRRTKE